MYLRGLGDESSGWGLDLPPDYGMTLPVPSTTGPAASYDWTGLLTTAIKTYGTVETAKAQASAPVYGYPTPLTARPIYSPFIGAPSSVGGVLMPLLIVGAIGAGAFFLFK